MAKEMRMSQNNLEIRQNSDNEMILEGYAATFEEPTILYKIGETEYKEVIERGAFDETDMKDCCLKYNHSDNVPLLARTKGGSLELSVDNRGLFFRAKLLNTQSAKDVYTLVRSGALDKCSFAFTIKEDTYDRASNTRHIKKIEKLYDVAIVDIPAYDSTSVSARSFFESQVESERQNELEKTKLKIKLSLGGI